MKHPLTVMRVFSKTDEEVLQQSDLKLASFQDNKNLFLLFDFGDEWIFKIYKTTKKVIFDSNKHYPIITEEKGVNPRQYPDYEE